MKVFALILFVASFSVMGAKDIENNHTQGKLETSRSPASSIELKRLIEIDERRGCCSHHGGVSHCSYGTLYCQDGWTSGCGC